MTIPESADPMYQFAVGCGVIGLAFVALLLIRVVSVGVIAQLRAKQRYRRALERARLPIDRASPELMDRFRASRDAQLSPLGRRLFGDPSYPVAPD